MSELHPPKSGVVDLGCNLGMERFWKAPQVSALSGV